METENTDSKILNQAFEQEDKIKPEGYPMYPPYEDIYSESQNLIEFDIDPEDTTKIKELDDVIKKGMSNETGFRDDVPGKDLDIPGSELDDEDENIGNEDEENNYYSLGGDEHNNLEEDKG